MPTQSQAVVGSRKYPKTLSTMATLQAKKPAFRQLTANLAALYSTNSASQRNQELRARMLDEQKKAAKKSNLIQAGKTGLRALKLGRNLYNAYNLSQNLSTLSAAIPKAASFTAPTPAGAGSLFGTTGFTGGPSLTGMPASMYTSSLASTAAGFGSAGPGLAATGYAGYAGGMGGTSGAASLASSGATSGLSSAGLTAGSAYLAAAALAMDLLGLSPRHWQSKGVGINQTFAAAKQGLGWDYPSKSFKKISNADDVIQNVIKERIRMYDLDEPNWDYKAVYGDLPMYTDTLPTDDTKDYYEEIKNFDIWDESITGKYKLKAPTDEQRKQLMDDILTGTVTGLGMMKGSSGGSANWWGMTDEEEEG